MKKEMKTECIRGTIFGKFMNVFGGTFIAIFALMFMMGFQSVKVNAYTIEEPTNFEGWQYIGQFGNSSGYNKCYYIRGINNVNIEYKVRLYSWYSSTTQIQNPTVWSQILLVDTPDGIKLISEIYGNNFEIKYNYLNYDNSMYSVNLNLYNGIYYIQNTGTYIGSGNLYRCNAILPGANSFTGLYNYIVTGTSGNEFEYITEALNQDIYLGNYNTTSEPEYSFDETLGSLQNVDFKQVSNGDEGMVAVNYDQYTSTGVDLSQNGYGVVVNVVARDKYNDEPVITKNETWQFNPLNLWFYRFYFNAAGNIVQWLDGNSTGGGGHSFTYDDGNDTSTDGNADIYDDKTVYDILLRPYYYDGSNYTYGLTTTIQNVSYDTVGTQMYSTDVDSENDTSTNINVTTVNIRRYDYSTDNYYDYSNYVDSHDVYNYTYNITEGDKITNNDFSTVDNSTTNIVNYGNNYTNPKSWDDEEIDGIIKDWPLFLKLIKGLLNFITSGLIANSSIFEFLPAWSTQLAFSLSIALGALLVFKLGR